MTITVELLNERIDRLKAERQMLIDKISAYNGAIQQIEWTLEQLSKPESGDGEPQQP